MRGASRTIAVLTLVVALAIPYTLAHSYLTTPISRTNQRQSNNGCRGPSCTGPCDARRTQSGITAPVRVQRGQTISVQWPRNNHAGGFVRLAWARFDQSDSHTAFDDGVQKVVCHEVGGCFPDDSSNPNGGDSGPADGSRRACTTSVTVPQHLPDGRYTLQWSWFGGAFQLGDYYSCVDYEVAGGPTGPRQDPFFQGGDYTYPNQQRCKYFSTNALRVCVNEPCTNAPSPGERSGAVANSTLWGTRTPSTSGGSTSSSSSGSSSSSSSSGSTSTSTSGGSTSSSSGTGSTSGGSSSSGGSNTGNCAVGTNRCNPAPESGGAQYQCCASGATCFPFADKGVCCGPSTVGCVYTANGTSKSACCDTRYLKCDSSKGCVNK